ncbi:MAG: hypothetical protein CVV49_02830 [Spirochaetae bacterium HGW-Spirochaetae-5]|nr:MAG: hypothetical protein CVV49_02830 [Spirochaetae bacterium HGW-Spirochaetae-5]
MKPYQKILFPVIVALQIAVLGFMITKQEMLLARGTKVLLKCQPIDPRSLFSGDYVILNYEISIISEEIISKSGIDDTYKLEKKDIYVALKPKPDGKYYTAAAISQRPDELKKLYPIIIKGRVEYASNTLQIRYGVESYFVPQREGKIIEESLKNVSVEVSVSESGESAISKLFIDGKEVKFY